MYQYLKSGCLLVVKIVSGVVTIFVVESLVIGALLLNIPSGFAYVRVTWVEILTFHPFTPPDCSMILK